jgi:hypothetical protein
VILDGFLRKLNAKWNARCKGHAVFFKSPMNNGKEKIHSDHGAL